MRITISTLLRAAFGAMALGCLAAVGVWHAGSHYSAAAVERAQAAQAANLAFEKLLRGLGESILSGSASTTGKAMREGMEALDRDLVGLAALGADARAANESWQKMKPVIAGMLAQKKLAADDDATMLAFGRLSGLLDETSKQLSAFLASSRAEADRVSRWVLVVTLAQLLIGLAGAVALAWFLPRRVARPLEHAVAVVRRIASGDLTQPIAAGRDDEVGDLVRVMGTMQDSLRAMIAEVRVSSDSIVTGSARISSGNSDLAQRTEEQAGRLQRAAASMSQMNVSVQRNAEAAHNATRYAESASAVAGKGGQMVAQVVNTMQAISAQSAKIADIIGVIDGIAFQTNILALNAAVEAARAGEQGRGFAVVAGEVRTLAQRSAGAAREIKALIGQSAERVEAGTRLVGEAGTTMDDIVTQVRRVAELIAGIGAATAEQGDGIEQVNAAVTELDQVTRSNASLVVDGANAAGELERQARRLADHVGAFKVAARQLAA